MEPRNPSMSSKTTTYDVLRNMDLLCTFQFKKMQWTTSNKIHFISPPLFWIKQPNLKKFIPDQSPLVQTFAQDFNIEPADLNKYLWKNLKKGTCHGQCLALVEKIMEKPDLKPQQLLKELGRCPERMMFFQVLEYIRGEDPAKYTLDFYRSYPHQVLIEYQGLYLNLPLQNYLVDNQGAYIMRLEDDQKKFYHSFLFVHLNQSFWFYDSKTMGIYEFPTPEQLFKEFQKVIKLFFCPSSQAYLTIENLIPIHKI